MIFGDTPTDKRHRTANIFDGFNLTFVPFAFYSHNKILTKIDFAGMYKILFCLSKFCNTLIPFSISE
jgi:hypothetical protein